MTNKKTLGWNPTYFGEPKKGSLAAVVQDITDAYNKWHGILSSDNNGLGWMMWGDTTFSKSNFSLFSGILGIINLHLLQDCFIFLNVGT